MRRDEAPKATHGTVGKARKLRRTMTLPEILMWQALRKRPDRLKFRRQHPCGPYILDFYCGDALVAIEVDGATHATPEGSLRDRTRDARLNDAGIVVIRVPAHDVLRDVGAVVVAVLATCRPRLPLHHPAAPGGPPPRARLGEE